MIVCPEFKFVCVGGGEGYCKISALILISPAVISWTEGQIQ